MTNEELRQLHPPRLCNTPNCGRTLHARFTELGLPQTHGWKPGAVYECECGTTRVEPLKGPCPTAA